VSEARARFEYRLRYDPKYIFRLECDKCGKPTHFTYEQILSLLLRQKRPKPMPHDHFWASILFELKVWKDRDHRAVLGGRVLVQRLLVEPGGDWYGTLKSISPYAPSLQIGSYVMGRPRGNYEICLSVIEDGNPKPIPVPPKIPRTRSFGMFVSPKENDGEFLFANIACSNPSCNHVYSAMTYTKFKEMIAQAQKEQADDTLYDEETYLPTLMLECPACGISRVIDEASFEGLYKEK
jgi:hypothetical protein